MNASKWIKIILVLTVLLTPIGWNSSRVGVTPVQAANSAPSVSGVASAFIDNDSALSVSSSNTIRMPLVTHKTCLSSSDPRFGIQLASLTDVVSTQSDQSTASGAAFSSVVEALCQSGASWVRVYIDWTVIEPNAPVNGVHTYNWKFYDSRLAAIATTDISVLATIANPPAWASANPDGIRKINDPNSCSNVINDSNVQDYVAFATALVSRYSKNGFNVHAWEILNEPDALPGYRCGSGLVTYGNSGDQYGQLVNKVSPAIKALDPTAKVIMGGIAYDWFYSADPTQGQADGKFSRYFIDAVASTPGISANLDGVNIHYFRDFHGAWEAWTGANQPTCGIVGKGEPSYSAYGLDILAKATNFENRLSVCFNLNKPLWVSEAGHHGINPALPVAQIRTDDTLENQARYVFTVHARAFAGHVANVTWYALKIEPLITSNDYQGLLFDSRDGAALDNAPKPAYYAYRTLTSELRSYNYTQTLNWGSNVEAYQFTDGSGKNKVIAWVNPGGSSDTTTIDVTTAGVRLVYHPNGDGSSRVTSISDGQSGDQDNSQNGHVQFTLGEEPVIVNLNP